MKRAYIVGGLLIAVALAAVYLHNRQQPPISPLTPTQSTAEAGQTFDKQQYSLSDPASLWVIVNKHRPLMPADYTPTDLAIPNVPLRSTITATEKQLRKPAADALENLVSAAKGEGIHFNLQSGFRSYAFQVSLYNRYVREQGQSVADSQSARPGYSEHQTGLAADLGGITQPDCDVEQCFTDTAEGKWLAANAYRYGFIVRYPLGRETTTGYIYEPWHIRYVGMALAAEMRQTKADTMEDFFGVGNAGTYQ